ncbi:hypothetical protein GOV11_01985 [Candidatus Woesearchaeota archaeon]|nr:hypothetical protein [Candidatus Woesearchaeota archaeon]
MAKKKHAPKVRKVPKKSTPHRSVLTVSKKLVSTLDKEFGEFLKAAVLFGSCATETEKNHSDIDILFIIDDVTHEITPETTLHYRDVIAKTGANLSPRFHVNTLKLTNFWEYCREGDPVVSNMLRDGHILLDRGFFGAAQSLLSTGRIRPSREAVWTYYTRSQRTLKSAQKHLLSASVDLYWAAIDVAHAALMSVGELPATPEHVPNLLQSILVKKGMLEKRHPTIMRELYQLQKGITQREIREITGEQYEGYYLETLKLVDALRTVVEMHPPGR